MSNHETIENELKNLGSSLPVTNSPSFSVPDDYFEVLTASILAKVKNGAASTAQTELRELSPLLHGLQKTMPYDVPSSYFEENLHHLPFKEIKDDSPILAAAGKGLPYLVPADYFDALPTQVLAKVSVPKVKVVPLFARGWMRA